jgi:hypothetical protein
MECHGTMVRCIYYPHKYNPTKCYWCTKCGKLVTDYGLTVWRGERGHTKGA